MRQNLLIDLNLRPLWAQKAHSPHFHSLAGAGWPSRPIAAHLFCQQFACDLASDSVNLTGKRNSAAYAGAARAGLVPCSRQPVGHLNHCQTAIELGLGSRPKFEQGTSGRGLFSWASNPGLWVLKSPFTARKTASSPGSGR